MTSRPSGVARRCSLAVAGISLVLGWLLSGCGPARRDFGSSRPYNEAWQIGTHNSFWAERKGGDLVVSGPGERLLDQLLADHARSLELDIHRSEKPHAFRVYHVVPGDSLCDDLEECLAILRGFHRTLPQHQPLLVLLELLDLVGPMFDDQHTQADLDQVLTAGLGPALYRPADFLGPCEGHSIDTLSQCARAVGWPSLADLQGRVMVGVMGYWHGGGAQDDLDWVDYATSDIRAHAAFPLADTVDWDRVYPVSQAQLTRERFQQALAQSLFMQSEEIDDPAAADFVANQGVVRMDNAFTIDKQQQVVMQGMQIIQTDLPAIAWQDQGPAMPFRAFPGTPPVDLREPGYRLALQPAPPAQGRAFAYRRAQSPSDTTWETVLSAGRSPGRVACLRAADSLGEGRGASITVCRHVRPNRLGPDAVGMVLQVDTCQEARCVTESFPATDGAMNETMNGTVGGPGELLAVRVQVQPGRTCLSAQAARLVTRELVPLWAPLGAERCVNAELTYQGLARAGALAPAADDGGAVYFFRTLLDGAPLRAAALHGVAIEPADGSPARTDSSALVDLSM